MNRGSASPAGQVGVPRVASMRPRFMNRGSGLPDASLFVRRHASMRPRFMNRGSIDFPHVIRLAVFRFNEAPIHESGKYRTARPPSSPSWSFNEAPIHESGKYLQEGPGAPDSATRFNEAPIHESGKYA